MEEIDKNVGKLFIAIKHNNHEDQKQLLQGREWIHGTDLGGRTALTWAIIFGDRLTTRRIITRTTRKGLNMADKEGCSALHYAVMEGRTDVVKSLLKKGAKVNMANNLGMTCLHYAAQTLNEFMITMLLSRNANRMSLDHQRRLPYHVALQWGTNPNILKLLKPDDFQIRKMGIPSPDVLRGAERYHPFEKAEDKAARSKEMARKWVLAAKQYATTTEKAPSRDHVVAKVKKEMEEYEQNLIKFFDTTRLSYEFKKKHPLHRFRKLLNSADLLPLTVLQKAVAILTELGRRALGNEEHKLTRSIPFYNLLY
ncbi:unnamed protein product [Calypogeia fissa]